MKFFISYNRVNRRLVEILANDLRTAGYEVWYDVDIVYGQSWWSEILSNIRECDVFIFTLTTHSLKSAPCMAEYQYAHVLNKCIFPIRLSDVDVKKLPVELKTIQYGDYRQHSKEEALRLIKAINKLPSAKPMPNPLPIEPEMPSSKIDQISNQVNKSNLNEDEQRQVLSKLEDLLENESTASEAYELLEDLREREYLLASIHRKIEGVLTKTPPFPSKAKNATLEPRSFVGHVGNVNSVAFSPDNSLIASSGEDFTVRLWDAVTGDVLHDFQGHDGIVSTVLFTSDGKGLLTASYDKTVRLWDIKTKQTSAQFIGNTDHIFCMSISGDGKYIATGSRDGSVRLWDIQNARELKKVVNQNFLPQVTSIAFSPKGDQILFGDARASVQLWDTKSKNDPIQFVGHTDTIHSVTFSNDGQYIITSSRDNTIRLWDISTQGFVRAFVGLDITSRCALFSRSDAYILGGGSSRELKSLQLWDTNTGELLQHFKIDGIVTCAVLSSDGKYVLLGSNEGLVYIVEPYL